MPTQLNDDGSVTLTPEDFEELRRRAKRGEELDPKLTLDDKVRQEVAHREEQNELAEQEKQKAREMQKDDVYLQMQR